jgi:uncharacterized protein YehS (DUF1456 family)
MDNNYILRSLRYALNINDATMLKIFALGGYKTNEPDIISLLKKEDDKDLLVCSNDVMRSFLDGLIIHKRGVQENKTGSPEKQTALNNNVILKKIRIALNFKEDEMLATFKLAGLDVKKPELTAIFRRPDHKNYKECGDQFIRNFLRGLTLKNR